MKADFFRNLIQFILAMLLAWVILYVVPSKWIFETYIPFSFFLLMWMISFAIIGRGWPYAPPDGGWKPGRSKVMVGILMTALTVLVATVFTLFITKCYPAIPLFPVTINYGAFMFITTVWYAFIWQSFPIDNRPAPLRLLISTITVTCIATILWYALVNFKGTPFENLLFIPKGLFPADYMLGLMVWVLVWIMFFGCTMQGYPFDKLRAPLDRITQTVAIAILGTLCWNATIKFISPGFSFAAIGGSFIAWSLFQSSVFNFFPVAKHDQRKRSIYSLIAVVLVSVVWIPLVRIIMLPIAHKAILEGVTFDVSAIGLFYALHVIAVFLVMHNAFWFQMPFPLSTLGVKQK